MKRLAWGLAALLAMLAALGAAAFFLLATPGGFRWLAETASELGGERLKVEGVEGHLDRKSVV